MSRRGKADAVLAWLRGCPQLGQLLSLNGQDDEEGAASVTTQYEDAALSTYIDGTVERRYTVSIRFVAPWSPYHDATNSEAMLDAEAAMDWVDGQWPDGDVPDMGERCEVTGIESRYSSPVMAQVLPDFARAVYEFNVSIDYTDRSKSWQS